MDEVIEEGRVLGIDFVILEREDDAAHRQIPQQQQPDRAGGYHGQEHQRLLCLAEPSAGAQIRHTFGIPGLLHENASCLADMESCTNRTQLLRIFLFHSTSRFAFGHLLRLPFFASACQLPASRQQQYMKFDISIFLHIAVPGYGLAFLLSYAIE